MLLSFGTVSCTKEEIVEIQVKVCQDSSGVIIDCPEKDWLTQFKLLRCDKPDTRTSWTRELDGFLLYHTDGLRQMALSGSIDKLDKEYCDAGLRGKRIPSGLGDDPHGQGYASVLELNGWLIAMYHFGNNDLWGQDHWIMYRIDDGYWERWDLGVRKERATSSVGNPGEDERGIHLVFKKGD